MVATVAPRNVEKAMPMLAAPTAAMRLRLTPWKDAKPAGSAPSAAKPPSSRWPLAQPRASGTTTPTATRAACQGAKSSQWTGPSCTSCFHWNPPGRITRDLGALTSAERPRARDAAQVGPSQLQHSPHTSVQHHVRRRQRESRHLGDGDVRRDRQGVRIGDEVDQGGTAVAECFCEACPHVSRLLDADRVDARSPATVEKRARTSVCLRTCERNLAFV